jgi:hypothetical protein
MAKVKNIGRQPRGFYDEKHNLVVVAQGEEAEFNMKENDYKKQQELLEACGDPKPFEISGGPGGVSKPGKKSVDAPPQPPQQSAPQHPTPQQPAPQQAAPQQQPNKAQR